MARLNITIPDDLYGRLEQHRDQLNLSRVCAASLQEEVDRLAGQPGPPDPAVTTLLLRLEGVFDRWYGRGVADGRSWTADRGSPRELRTVATRMADWTGEQLLAALEERRAYRAAPSVDPMVRPPLFPDSFDLERALQNWQRDNDTRREDVPSPQELLAYVEGWRDGVVELWTAAEPLLRRSIGNLDRRREASNAVRGDEQRTTETGSQPVTAHTLHAPGWTSGGTYPWHYDVRLDRDIVHSGQASVLVRSVVDDPVHFCSLWQNVRADAYCGKRLRLSAYVRAAAVRGWAGLWLRVDDLDNAVQKSLYLENMQDRPIRGTSDWQQYEIVLDVPRAGEEIFFGALLNGSGAIWVDDFRFDIVGTDVPLTSSKREIRPAPINLGFEE